MFFIKTLPLAVFALSALGVFEEKDKEILTECTKVLLGTALLYIIAVFAETIQNYPL